MTLLGNRARGGRIPRSVGAAAEFALGARGDTRRLGRVLEHSLVPMLMLDGQRRILQANSPARLAFRLSLEELRSYALDDLASPHAAWGLERAWAQLLEAGAVAGALELAGPDGGHFEIVYCALSNLLPGAHLLTFVPADWPEDELAPIEVAPQELAAPLTRREIELLALAAEGSNGPELAEQLAVSPMTVNTHFKHIYAKLAVHSRAAAVARAMRLGLIDC